MPVSAESQGRKKIVMIALIRTFLLLLGLLTSGCSISTDDENLLSTFSTPTGAYDIKKLQLGTRDNQQLFFRIKDSYPSMKSIDYFENIFVNEGWDKCFGISRNWIDFEDQSTEPHFYIHRVIRYWVQKEFSRMVVLSATYYSKTLADEKLPDNDIQNVALLVQANIDIEVELSRLQLSCSEDTGS